MLRLELSQVTMQITSATSALASVATRTDAAGADITYAMVSALAEFRARKTELLKLIAAADAAAVAREASE